MLPSPPSRAEPLKHSDSSSSDDSDPDSLAEENLAEKNELQKAETLPPTEVARGRARQFRGEVLTREWMIFTFVYYVVQTSFTAYYPTTTRRLHRSATSNFFGYFMTSRAFFAIFFGLLVDYISTIPICIVLNLMSVSTLIFELKPHHVELQYISIVCFVISNSYVYITKYCYMDERFPPLNFGILVGSIGSIAGVFIVLLIPVGDYVDPVVPYAVFLGFTLLSMPVLVYLMMRQKWLATGSRDVDVRISLMKYDRTKAKAETKAAVVVASRHNSEVVVSPVPSEPVPLAPAAKQLPLAASPVSTATLPGPPPTTGDFHPSPSSRQIPLLQLSTTASLQERFQDAGHIVVRTVPTSTSSSRSQSGSFTIPATTLRERFYNASHSGTSPLFSQNSSAANPFSQLSSTKVLPTSSQSFSTVHPVGSLSFANPQSNPLRLFSEVRQNTKAFPSELSLYDSSFPSEVRESDSTEVRESDSTEVRESDSEVRPLVSGFSFSSEVRPIVLAVDSDDDEEELYSLTAGRRQSDRSSSDK